MPGLSAGHLIFHLITSEHARNVNLISHEKWTETVAPLVAGIQKAQAELIANYSEEVLDIIVDFLTRFTNNVKECTETIDENLL